MSFRNLATEKFILPLADRAAGLYVSKYLKFLLTSQWWDREKLLEYQNLKLIELVTHAFTNVPYYQKIFNEYGIQPKNIQSLDDLNALPILTKEEIRKNVRNGSLIAKNIPKSEIIKAGSSGSTGEPLQYYVTKKSYSFNLAANLRGWYWMGYRLGDFYLKLSQNPRSKKKRIQDKLNNSLYLHSQKLTETQFESITEQFIKYAPPFVRGYPDVLLYWAEYVHKHNVKLPQVAAINTTGNTLFPASRKFIQETFQAPVFDAYACEGGANVFECETRECYHSSMEYAISEIMPLNEANNSREGVLISTDLQNYAVPFIRYNTQDVLVPAENKCSCGRELQLIEKIKGRASDILVTPSGQYLIVHNFTGYFEWVDAVEQFQIHQTSNDELLFNLKVNKQYNSNTEKEIVEYWSRFTGNSMRIRIQPVMNIPLTQSGKRRFLIRDESVQL